MRHPVFRISAGFAALCCAGTLSAQQPAPSVESADSPTASRSGARTLLAVDVRGAAPVIDGRLDDEVWQRIAPATDFTVYEPNSGAPSSQRTEARVAYDDRAIYIGVRLFDTSPDSIVAQLARRDVGVHSDWIYVGLDSYFDRRTGYVFGVNPRGVKVDIMLYDDVSETGSWDAIWDVATSIDSLGWSAEFRIPISQLRFARESDGDRIWGVQFRRQIARTGESSLWAPVPRDANGVVSLFGELHGLRTQPRRHAELVPYTVASTTRAPVDADNPFFRRNDTGLSLGADLRYGVTSNLTLNATINPDFGQVEADPSVVNLTAFETFLPEKRPFFVEGANIFNFGIGVGDGDLGNESLFYSRRIGRSPQGAVPGAAAFRDVPSATTIRGAAKLSGRTASGWSVGILDAVTAPEHGRYVLRDGARGNALVEPATNYAVARAMRDFSSGASTVGAIVTATNRSLDGELPYLRSSAYTGGFNARHRMGDFELKGTLVGSRVAGDTAAINRTQRSATRYYQRPDNDYVSYDPLRTSLAGWAASAELMKMGGGHWRYAAILNARSPGFEPNDLGYMQNADQALQVFYVGYSQFTPTPRFRRWNVNMNQWYGTNFGGDRLTFGGNLNGGFQLPSFWGANMGVNREQPWISVAALRGGPALRTPGHWSTWFSGYTDSRQDVRFNLNADARTEPETGASGWGVRPGMTVRAASRAEVSIATSYSRNERASQYVTTRSANGASRYVVGHLEQHTAALTARVNYTATPTMSLQLYAQPFISAGRYDGFMEVARPRAQQFDERFSRYTDAQIAYDAKDRVYRVDRDGDGSADLSFGNPDFNFRQMRSTAVMRWEYRPGSSLYLVWSHGRTAQDEDGAFRFNRDVGELWDAAGTNVLLLKFSYWLGS
jgi:hypothetical protein